MPSLMSSKAIKDLFSRVGDADDSFAIIKPEVEQILLELADNFVENVTSFACTLAKHRKSNTLEVKDLQLHLEKNWNMKVAGFMTPIEVADINKKKSTAVNENLMSKLKPLRHPVLLDTHRKRKDFVEKALNNKIKAPKESSLSTSSSSSSSLQPPLASFGANSSDRSSKKRRRE